MKSSSDDLSRPSFTPNERLVSKTVTKVVMTYVGFAALWIALSDQALLFLFSNPKHIALASTAKGYVFIALTASLLAVQLHRYLKAIANESAKNKALMHLAGDGIHVLDAKGNVLQANEVFCRQLGYSHEEVLKMNVAQWDARWTESELKVVLSEFSEKGKITLFETRHRRRDGQTIDVEISVTGIEIDGETLLYCSSRDITARKRESAALQESETRFRLMFERTADALLLLDPAVSQFIECNQAAAAMLHFQEGKFSLPLHPAQLSPPYQPDGRPSDEKAEEMIETALRNGSHRFEWIHCSPHRADFPVEVLLTPIMIGERKVIMTTWRDISERKQSEEKIKFLAYHDVLTGLPNRTLTQDRFHQASAYADRLNSKVAMLYLDLDNFKTINDSLGHVVGDGLVKEVAKRLTECVRDTDTISRLGGDEFLILLPGLVDAEAIAPVLVNLMNRLVEPMMIEGHELVTSASIGITFYPDDGNDFDSLMKKADVAMYRAKDAGRNTYRLFDPQMNVEAVEQLKVRNGLRRALAQDEFVLHYQPQIDLATGALVGAEALIRWNHPELGTVPPTRFIPIAEDSGLIIPIGEWVLREACRQAVSWQRMGMHDLIVAVNLSAVQFKRGDIEQSIVRAIEESGLNPSLLELELTESILIHDTEKILGTVTRLKQIGVKLSIDDFGTGYSSLSYLKRFQVDKIKIDQSFVKDLPGDEEDAAIVRAIIQMARSLGLMTIAEGVETENALRHLREIGCDEAQGYYYARPMPSDEFSAFRTRMLTGPERVIPPNTN